MKRFWVVCNVKCDEQNFCAQGDSEGETKEEAAQKFMDRMNKDYQPTLVNCYEVE